MIKKESGGYRLYSKKSPGRALGPARASKEDVMAKDEKRVEYFKKMRKMPERGREIPNKFFGGPKPPHGDGSRPRPGRGVGEPMKGKAKKK